MRFTGMILVLMMLSACAKDGGVMLAPMTHVDAAAQCCITDQCTKTQYVDSGVTMSCFSPKDDPMRCSVCLRAGG